MCAMQIIPISSPEFLPYGRIVAEVRGSRYAALLKDRAIPKEVEYIPMDPALQALSDTEHIQVQTFGCLPIQAGYCAGHNRKLNALEYHACSEVNIAVTDLVLLLGHRYDIDEKGTYHTEKVQAFFLPAGTAVELYSSTLHFAPCGAGADGAFKAVVILPAGVNAPLIDEDCAGALCGVSKWILKHREYQGQGLCGALIGENLSI